MRHGANIPDIRALQTALADVEAAVNALTVSLDGAAVNSEPVQGFVDFALYEERKVLQENILTAEISNPGPSTIKIGPFGRYGITLSPGDSITVTPGGGQSVWAQNGSEIGYLYVDARRSTVGELTYNIGSATVLGSDAGTTYPFGPQFVIDTTSADDTLRHYRINGFEVGSLDLSTFGGGLTNVTEDPISGAGFFLADDGSDIWRLDIVTESANLVASLSADVSFVRAFQTDLFDGYFAEDFNGDVTIFDADFTSVTTTNVPDAFTIDPASNRVAGNRYYFGADTSGVTGIFDTSSLSFTFYDSTTEPGNWSTDVVPFVDGFVLADSLENNILINNLQEGTVKVFPGDILSDGAGIDSLHLFFDNFGGEELAFIPETGDYFKNVDISPDDSIRNVNWEINSVSANVIEVFDALDSTKIFEATFPYSVNLGFSGNFYVYEGSPWIIALNGDSGNTPTITPYTVDWDPTAGL